MRPAITTRPFAGAPSLARVISRAVAPSRAPTPFPGCSNHATPIRTHLHRALLTRGFSSTSFRHSPIPSNGPPFNLPDIFSGMSRWGWVVYRTAYGPGTDELWARYQAELKRHTSAMLSKVQDSFNRDPPKNSGEIIPWNNIFAENGGGLEWSFISDKTALEGAKIDDVREMFKKKVHDEGLFPPNWAYFAVADEACLKGGGTGKKVVVLVKTNKEAKIDMETFGADGFKELPWGQLGMRSINIRMSTLMLGGMMAKKLTGNK
ncbi:hypothetical protein QBC44DRAFT_306562 [Cladorrhinum sp. PSN332]|nr:hypothetical protein QBC44DRAFT_306562 [Cladorrhinum sp. PSN332]